jgi:SAM-dependent MidA family methyltransferase
MVPPAERVPPPGVASGATSDAITKVVVETIHRNGPITFAELQALALYHPEGGFFTVGGGAGRAGRDFVTSPEVGSLFGTLVARQLDGTWDRLERPDPFVVVEAGAGRGRCAADVLRAGPACAPALRYLVVDRSPALRAAQRDLLTLEPADEVLGPVLRAESEDEAPEPVKGVGPMAASLDDLPAVAFVGCVFANELIDNLPVRIVERRDDGWSEVRVGLDAGGAPCEVVVSASVELAREADHVAAGSTVPTGARLPIAEEAAEWLRRVGAVLRRGEVVLVDFMASVDELVARGQEGWLRTYRGHGAGTSPLDDLGAQDITSDVAIEHLCSAARRAGFEVSLDATQAEWLGRLGIQELVAEGRSVWDSRAHIGDVAALAGRSRVHEAEALTDLAGLGAHRVVVLSRDLG